ncbi:MAG TPA: hypothetical protein VIX17_02640 [Pyrinomonadaceae bacterium]
MAIKAPEAVVPKVRAMPPTTNGGMNWIEKSDSGTGDWGESSRPVAGSVRRGLPSIMALTYAEYTISSG